MCLKYMTENSFYMRLLTSKHYLDRKVILVVMVESINVLISTESPATVYGNVYHFAIGWYCSRSKFRYYVIHKLIQQYRPPLKMNLLWITLVHQYILMQKMKLDLWFDMGSYF